MRGICTNPLIENNYDLLQSVVDYWAFRFVQSRLLSLDDWKQEGWVVLLENADDYDPSKSGIKTWASMVLRARFCNIVAKLRRESCHYRYYRGEAIQDPIVETVCALDDLTELLLLLSPCARCVVEGRLCGRSFVQIGEAVGWTEWELSLAVTEVRITCESLRQAGRL